MNPTKTFLTDEALVAYANDFAGWQLRRFKKDVEICLTANKDGSHAYFPALMACIGVFELFSGLYAGTLWPELNHLKAFTRKFLPSSYSDDLLAVLYHCFRHKVAHLSHPYDVFDTQTKPDFKGQSRRLISWKVDETDADPALELRPTANPIAITRAPDGWNVVFDHLFYVHLGRFSKDIIDAIEGNDGYLSNLKIEKARRTNFEACMKEYFSV